MTYDVVTTIQYEQEEEKPNSRPAIYVRKSWGTIAKKNYETQLIGPVSSDLTKEQMRGHIRAVLYHLIHAAMTYNVCLGAYIKKMTYNFHTYSVPFPTPYWIYTTCIPKKMDDVFTFYIKNVSIIPALMINNDDVVINPQDWYQLAKKVQYYNEIYHKALEKLPLPLEVIQYIKMFIDNKFPLLHNWIGFLEVLPKCMTGGLY